MQGKAVSQKNKNTIKRATLIGTAFIFATLLVSKMPEVYDFGLRARQQIVLRNEYNRKAHISRLTSAPKGARKIYDISDRERQSAKIIEGGEFGVGITPVAIFESDGDFFVQVRVHNRSEKLLTAGFKTRGLLKEDPPGCPTITPSQEYRVPSGKKFNIYVLGDKVAEGWLRSKEGKTWLKLWVGLDTPEQGGFREIVLELPASKELERTLTQAN